MEQEPFERLRLARERAGFATATDAARRFNWNENTYRSHENGERGLKPKVAQKYATAFRVSQSYLLTGEGGVAEVGTTVPLEGIIGAGGAILTDSEQPDPGACVVAEIRAQLFQATTGYEVVGTSMMPFFRPGTLIVCGPARTNMDGLYGDELACCDEGGNRFLKIVHPGSREGLYDLQSHNASLMRDVKLQWVAEIVAIIPEKQWRKMERSASVARLVRSAG